MLNFREITAYVKRDLNLEWRHKSVIGGAAVYLITVVFICLHAFESFEADVWNALFWIVLSFAIMMASARSFDQEQRNAFLSHFHLTKPVNLIISKLLYNIILALLMALVGYAAFTLFLGNEIADQPTFLLTLCLGAIGLGSIYSLTAAITARSDGNLVLMALLSLPLILPLILLLINLTARSFGAYSFQQNLQLFGATLILILSIIILCIVLFPYLWRD